MRDLIYFDVAKAASLLSQLEGGLLQEITNNDELAVDSKKGLEANIYVFKADLGRSQAERSSRAETRVLHHSLLTRLEGVLSAEQLTIHLNEELVGRDVEVAAVRAAVERAPYLTAEGWAVIEDYERLKRRISHFNPLIDLMGRSARAEIEASPDYQRLKQQLEEQKQIAGTIKDRKQRNDQLQQLNSAEKQLSVLLDQATAKLGRLEEWLVEGVQLWIDSFNPSQIHLRIYPFEQIPNFQVLANLKRDCFVDQDIEHLLFSYGTRPNVKLSIFGLISSLPRQAGPSFDPMSEFQLIEETASVGEHMQFERAFRQAFVGLQELESFGRFDRYPNVTILPIAVFRNIRRDMR